MLNFEYHSAIPGIREALFNTEDIIWWGRRDNVITLPCLIDGASRYNDGGTDLDTLPAGLLMGKVASTGKLKQWDSTATDGTQYIFGVLMHEQKMQAAGANLDRLRGHIMVAGPMKPSGFIVSGTTTRGINGQNWEQQVRQQFQNRAVFDDEPQMNVFGGWRDTRDITADATLVEADNNVLFTNNGATGSVTFTLPATGPKEGYRFGFYVANPNEVIIMAASGAPIIADGDATCEAVAMQPHIGEFVEIIGISTTKYIAIHSQGDVDKFSGNRYRLEWTAGEFGLPQLNASIAPSSADDGNDGATAAEIAAMLVCDPHFEISGTGASDDDVTYDAEGGITLETDGGGNDQVILGPHQDTNLTPWANITWGTDQETIWECRIRTGAAVTNMAIIAGLKLAVASPSAIGTDADQACFWYRTDHATVTTQWLAVSSGAAIGADDEHDTNVDVLANTDYHLKIAIGNDRKARFYINGVHVETSAALDDTTDLIPYIAVEDLAGAARSITVRGQAIERNAA